MGFLPVTKQDMIDAGWDAPDFVIVTGDAYVDHPSFGTAIISRVLEGAGYKVAVLAQPDWKSARDFQRFGKPRLGFLINSGNVDSMVNHFSSWKNRRKTDSYSPGGISGKRPDRAVIVYSSRAREAYKDTAVIIGGLEASLRRLGHYDYWSDKVRRSILLDAKADILLYGMGEKSVVEVADALNDGFSARDITWVRGTVVRSSDVPEEGILLPSYESLTDGREYAKSFKIQYENNDAVTAKPLAEPYGDESFVIQNPPQMSLTQEELDHVYGLSYMRNSHPMYDVEGGVPALTEIRHSITASRGCFGGCAFCALTYHQGRAVSGRSKGSIVNEAKEIIGDSEFKGYIHDVGGPTANFRRPACKKQQTAGMCKDRDCLFPEPCPNLDVSHEEYLEILRSVRNLPGVKKVFIRSGIRFDYVMADRSERFLKELCEHHVSGTLKVAPEHVSENVLRLMRKPEKEVFERFYKKYMQMNKQLQKEQYLIPYFISSHPGSTLADAVCLAVYLKQMRFIPDQVQDFYPTPGTLATCMYYTGIDPLTGEDVYVAKTPEEKRMQRALLHFHKPENRTLVKKALEKAGREDLIPVLLGTNPQKYPHKNIQKNTQKEATNEPNRKAGRNPRRRKK